MSSTQRQARFRGPWAGGGFRVDGGEQMASSSFVITDRSSSTSAFIARREKNLDVLHKRTRRVVDPSPTSILTFSVGDNR